MSPSVRRLAALVFAVAGVAPLAAAEPPASVLDLTHWKLTLPIETDLPGRPDEIQQPELASFEHPLHFFVNDAGDGVVFRAQCGGDTTRGSDYPRCELREMTAEGDQRAAWATDDGTIHTLTATLAVTQTPRVKPHVVCAQIHGGRDDLLKIRVERRKLMIERDGHQDLIIADDYTLGTPFDLKIEAGDGTVRVWHDGDLKLTWKLSQAGCYFKAGCYTQSNTDRGDAPETYGEVVIRRLSVTHRGESAHRCGES